MIILSIRTDKPEAEVGLYNDDKELGHISWQAHRQLGITLHEKIKQLFDKQDLDWPDIQGLVVYKGPGSFTGLRIGISVANALAYSYGIAIFGSTGDDWLKLAIKNLIKGKGEPQIMPFYGAEAHITIQKK